MKLRSLLCSIFLSLFAILPSTPAMAQANTANAISSHYATVDGVKLHYLEAGHGPTLLLLHGYAQDSRMWRPAIPVFAQKFTVIAPDLPGFGDSDIPADGLDMKSAAIRVHSLAKSLGITKARVVGHDALSLDSGRLRLGCIVCYGFEMIIFSASRRSKK